MIAPFVLTRSQLRVDPVQPSLRASPQLSVGPDCDYRHFQGRGAGLALLAVPMVESFTFTQAQFQRILSNFLGLEGTISAPHNNHSVSSVARVLTQGTVFSSASMPSARKELSST